MLGLGFVWMWEVEMRYADLTENLPLGSSIQMRGSGIQMIVSGRFLVEIAMERTT